MNNEPKEVVKNELASHPYFFGACIGAVAATALSFAATGQSHEVPQPKLKHSEPPVVATSFPTHSQPYSIDMMVVGKTDEFREQQSAVRKARKELDDAAAALSYETMDTIRIDEEPFVFYNKIETKADCISDVELDALITSMRAKHVGKQAINAVSLHGINLCHPTETEKKVKARTNAAAWVVTEKNAAVFTMGHTTRNVILHELGHLFALKHHAKIECINKDGEYTNETLNEVSELIAGEDCGPVRHTDGAINYYSSQSSVMGSNPVTDNRLAAYNSVDLNTINQDMFKIETIDPAVPNHYELSLDKNAMRGVRINLPEHHPVRQLPGSPDSLVFSLNTTNIKKDFDSNNIPNAPRKCVSKGDVLCEIEIAAVGPTSQVYDFEVAKSYLHMKYSDDQSDSPKKYSSWIYYDETLNFAVRYDRGERNNWHTIDVVALDESAKASITRQQANKFSKE